MASPSASTSASAPLSRLYNLDAARSDEQRRYMRELEDAGVCVFCPEHVASHHREPVEHSGRHWYVTRNDYPYEGAAAHYLLVANLHVTSFDELPDEAGAELWAIKRMLKAQLQPAALATVERSGNMLYNGGSVAHLHVHLVALEEEPSATVRFRVSTHA
jgi:ATP adenylyltransferase